MRPETDIVARARRFARICISKNAERMPDRWRYGALETGEIDYGRLLAASRPIPSFQPHRTDQLRTIGHMATPQAAMADASACTINAALKASRSLLEALAGT